MDSNEYTIGRCATSPIKVPADREGVSSRHVKITISNGVWTLEDLDSANGTYIRDDDGNFHRVYNKKIQESDIIRLGNGGANSIIFTAKRITDPAASYTYEFKQLRKQLKRQKELEAKKEKKISMGGWIASATGAIAYGLTWIVGWAFDIEIEPGIRYGLMAGAPLLVKSLFSGNTRELREVRQKREKVLVCPNPVCSKPISEYDIGQGQCSRCKAK